MAISSALPRPSTAGEDETESGRAICTAGVSVTGLSTGQSNPGRLRD